MSIIASWRISCLFPRT